MSDEKVLSDPAANCLLCRGARMFLELDGELSRIVPCPCSWAVDDRPLSERSASVEQR